MQCPHCLKHFAADVKNHQLGHYGGEPWVVAWCQCAACESPIVFLEHSRPGPMGPGAPNCALVYPRGTQRAPCPAEVPNEFEEDYREACLVLQDSPKASAALSRRCLQNVLREKAGVKRDVLYREVEEVLGGALPSYIADALHALREYGNFAAHATRDVATGEIIEVEAGEAEWLLDVLEALFDHYFVQPAAMAQRKAKLNEKLSNAGKPGVP